MNHRIRSAIAPLVLMACAACSAESGDQDGDTEHVWKEQTEAIDKAREVETILKRKQTSDQQENQ